MSKTQSTRSVPKVVPPDSKFPDWLKETPVYVYTLFAFPNHRSDDSFEILLTSKEYGTLKEVLAGMRGIYGTTERKQVLDCLRKKFDEAEIKEAA